MSLYNCFLCSEQAVKYKRILLTEGNLQLYFVVCHKIDVCKLCASLGPVNALIETFLNAVKLRLSELVRNVVWIIENSDNWIKFLSTKKQYCHVSRVPWLIITGSGLGGWIYWHFYYSYSYYNHLRITAHNRRLHRIRSVSLLDYECLLLWLTLFWFKNRSVLQFPLSAG
jgi:hypothetical protein